MCYNPVNNSDVKLVVRLHGNVGNDMNISNHDIYAKLEKGLMKSMKVNAICVIASLLENIFRNEYGEIKPPIKVILNAYDDKAFRLIDRRKTDKLTLCTIASYTKLKGQDRVIEALRNSNCEYRYLCIGYISEENKKKLDKKTKGLDFEWLGVKRPTEIREILAECDYMIQPSSSEGFGLVYLEAIACGVPVIIPKHLPLAQEGDILNDSNAIRIEDSSSKAIEAILPSLQARNWDRRTVSESIISYTWNNIAKEYVAQYASLIKD